jgi:hypothetical protein
MSLRVERGWAWALLSLASWSTLGCLASLESVSSGQVGCAEQDIVISDDEGGFGTRTWVATCRDKKYFCSAHASGEGSQVNCKEAAEERPKPFGDSSGDLVRRPERAPQPAEPAATGCQFDTQCKGDRICDDGECISPRPKKTSSTEETPSSTAAPAE